MEMQEKIDKLQMHLIENPADYQTQIALMKLNSSQIEWEIEQKRHAKARKIAECKRLLNGE